MLQTSHLEPNVTCELKLCDMLTVEFQTYFTDIVSRLFEIQDMNKTEQTYMVHTMMLEHLQQFVSGKQK